MRTRLLTCLHESGHLVIGFARRSGSSFATIANNDELHKHSDGVISSGHVQAHGGDPVVDFAGGVAAAAHLGLPWRVLTYRECCDRALCYRLQRLHSKTESSLPASGFVPFKATKKTHIENTAPALMQHIDGGIGGDINNAVTAVRAAVDAADIPDVAERINEEGKQTREAQEQAMKLCSDWLPEIRHVAAVLDAKGTLTHAEIEHERERAINAWAWRKTNEYLKKQKEK